MNAHPLAIIEDTGVPAGGADSHKVLILIHGWGFQSSVFTRMAPFAQSYNARLILVNRREYPGTDPFTKDERDLLLEAQQTDEVGAAAAKDVWTARGEEVLTLLESIVQQGGVPERSIILAGWSYAGLWMTSLLSLPPAVANRHDVGRYIRRIICYDTSYRRLGFPDPAPSMFSPFTDKSIAPEDIRDAFIHWITGYYSHTIPRTPGVHARSIVDGLEQRNVKKRTLFTDDELRTVVVDAPADVPSGGPDVLASVAAGKHGIPAMNLDAALHSKHCSHVELRQVWGDASFWEACVGGVEVARLVHEDGKLPKGKLGRPVSSVRWIGANHFAHWNYPERTLQGLLEDDVEDWVITS
ncbi:unnamed protein product [Peniophora sp. CBMAI 1063]|nr:unnamed protein product [Peniophora sp. CBMAI 1063]